jgi:hypothetical protein
MTTRTLRNHVHEFTFTQHGDQMCVGPSHNQDEAKFITEALSAYQEQSADVVAEAATT